MANKQSLTEGDLVSVVINNNENIKKSQKTTKTKLLRNITIAIFVNNLKLFSFNYTCHFWEGNARKMRYFIIKNNNT